MSTIATNQPSTETKQTQATQTSTQQDADHKSSSNQQQQQQQGPRVLITGATGLLGRALFAAFTNNNNNNVHYQVYGTGWSRAKGNIFKVDLKDPESVEKVISEVQPHIIIHSAAERRPDVCEKDEEATISLNVSATQHLAQTAQKHKSWFIYISSDSVFDGQNPPYSVNSKTNPLNIYGRSKLAAEDAALKVNANFAVLRIPLLYGSFEYVEECSVTQLIQTVLNNQKQTIVDDWSIRYPTACDDVATVCVQLCNKYLQTQSSSSASSNIPQIGGVYHWSCLEAYTKYELCQLLGELLQASTAHLQGDKEKPKGAPRAKNTHLECSVLENLGIGQRTVVKEGIKKMLDEAKQKKLF